MVSKTWSVICHNIISKTQLAAISFWQYCYVTAIHWQSWYNQYLLPMTENFQIVSMPHCKSHGPVQLQIKYIKVPLSNINALLFSEFRNQNKHKLYRRVWEDENAEGLQIHYIQNQRWHERNTSRGMCTKRFVVLLTLNGILFCFLNSIWCEFFSSITILCTLVGLL